jgi:hypothetical protein
VPHDVLTFIQPLTDFAARRVISFHVERLGADGAVAGTTAATTWQLDRQGHLITLSPELVLEAP